MEYILRLYKLKKGKQRVTRKVYDKNYEKMLITEKLIIDK